MNVRFRDYRGSDLALYLRGMGIQEKKFGVVNFVGAVAALCIPKTPSGCKTVAG